MLHNSCYYKSKREKYKVRSTQEKLFFCRTKPLGRATVSCQVLTSFVFWLHETSQLCDRIRSCFDNKFICCFLMFHWLTNASLVHGSLSHITLTRCTLPFGLYIHIYKWSKPVHNHQYVQTLCLERRGKTGFVYRLYCC